MVGGVPGGGGIQDSWGEALAKQEGRAALETLPGRQEAATFSTFSMHQAGGEEGRSQEAAPAENISLP